MRTPSQAKQEKKNDDSKIASKNTQEELGLKTTWQAQLEHIQTNENISALIITLIPLELVQSSRNSIYAGEAYLSPGGAL